MTPAPPDAPPTGAVCGAGVASVDALYDCAAGGRLSGASLGGDSEEADQGVAGAAPRPPLAPPRSPPRLIVPYNCPYSA